MGLRSIRELDEGLEGELSSPHLSLLLCGARALEGQPVHLHGDGEDRSVDRARLRHHAVLQARPELIELHQGILRRLGPGQFLIDEAELTQVPVVVFLQRPFPLQAGAPTSCRIGAEQRLALCRSDGAIL